MRTLAVFFAPLVVLVTLAISACYVKLLHGPIPLTFLAGSIEQGISAELGGLPVRVADVEMAFGEDGDIEFRLTDLRVFEADGDATVAVPRSAVELSGSALWRLRLVPSRVDLIDLRLSGGTADNGQLILSFRADEDPGRLPTRSDEVPATRPGGAPVAPQAGEVPPADTIVPGIEPGQRIDVARALVGALARARESRAASSYLRQVGLRNATLSVHGARSRTLWTISRASFSLRHGTDRSRLAGKIAVESQRGPWDLSFEASDGEQSNALKIEAKVADLVPSVLARAAPQLAILKNVDLPVSGTAEVQLSAEGEIEQAKLDLDTAQGAIRLPSIDRDAALILDRGRISLAFDGAAERFELAPSAFAWGASQMTLAGSMARDEPSGAWRFDLAAREGTLTAEEFGGLTLPLDTWSASGAFDPLKERLELASLRFAAGDGKTELRGEISTKFDDDSMRLEGVSSPMLTATAKTIWPRFMATSARSWLGSHVSRGRLEAGQFRYLSGSFVIPGADGVRPAEQFELSVGAADVVMSPQPDLPPIEIPSARIKVVDADVEINFAEARFRLAPGRAVEVQNGKFTATETDGPMPIGVVALNTRGPVQHVLSLLQRAAPEALGASGIDTASLDGTIDAQLEVRMPLLAQADAKSAAVSGRARLTDGRAKDVVGSYDIDGASVTFDFNQQAVDANGEFLLNGVLAKVNWQRIFDAAPDKQPPLRLTATLDNADRNRLGLDVNHLLIGDAEVEVTVTRTPANEPAVRVRADITNTELIIEGIAWRKVAGRPAVIQCDLAGFGTAKSELAQFKLAGEGIAIEGRVGLDKESRLKDFEFPFFSLDVITQLDVRGTVRADNVLAVKVKGQSLDGRNFFRSLFSVGKVTDENLQQLKPRAGIDIDADIENVIGFSEVSLRGLKVKLAKRSEKLSMLEARGTLDGGRALVAEYRAEPGQPRRLLADATDAGQAFRLTGFYPSVQGGRVRLEVNLDGRGPAEKTGILWVDQFRILGDPIASEVFSGASEQQGPAIGARGQGARRVTREVFDFDQMRVPFSVGHGQFVMEDAYMRGPALGASLRGKVDYGAQRMQLGGTYIPLQGLNNILGGIPVIGTILSGPRGEGIFGVTFAIQGPMAAPQVIVNPLSLVTPGIFREIFQMAPENPKVLPRVEPRATIPVQAPAAAPGGAPAVPGKSARPRQKPGPAVTDGWSSETLPAKRKM